MVIRGRVENGIVVLDEAVSLPEGTEVEVVVRAGAESPAQRERRRVLDILDRIADMPLEGGGGPVSGAEHDRALYGRP